VTARNAILVALTTALAGCMTPGTYWRDRGADLLDCATVQAGYGILAEAQVQTTPFIGTGLGMGWARLWGFDGRAAGRFERVHVALPFYPFLVPFVRRFGRELSRAIAEALAAPFGLELRPPAPVEPLPLWERLLTSSSVIESPGGDASPQRFRRRGAKILVLDARVIPAARSDPLFEDEMPPRHPVTALDMTVAATLMPVSARVGVSPGQILDFLLGWTTIDIANDDAKSQETIPWR